MYISKSSLEMLQANMFLVLISGLISGDEPTRLLTGPCVSLVTRSLVGVCGCLRHCDWSMCVATRSTISYK